MSSMMLLTRMPPPELIGPIWQLLAYNNGRGGVQRILADTQLTATFTSDGRVSGSGGCNTFDGSYELNGTSIKMGPFATTRMSCPQPIMDQEQAYLTALENSVQMEFVDGRLQLRDANGATQADFQAP